MRRCCRNRRRKCCRPPVQVRVGEQPFQVKQMSCENDEEYEWQDHWGCPGNECRPDYPCCGGFMPPPPQPRDFFMEDEIMEDVQNFNVASWDENESVQDYDYEGEDSEEKCGGSEAEQAPRFKPHPGRPTCPPPDAACPPAGCGGCGCPGHGCRPPRPRPWNCSGCNLKIKVFKYDSCHHPQAGVLMGLYRHGRFIRSGKTDERGMVIFNYLYPGLYTVRELQVPEGVEKDPTRFAVSLNRSCSSAVVVFRKGRCEIPCPQEMWPQEFPGCC